MSDPALELAARFQNLATRLLRVARTADREAGISSAQYSAMATLYGHAPLSLIELARLERVAHPTMSRVIGALVKSGAVRKTPDPHDRRAQRLELSEAGRATYERICARRIEIVSAILARLKPDTVADVLSALTDLVAKLDARPDPG